MIGWLLRDYWNWGAGKYAHPLQASVVLVKKHWNFTGLGYSWVEPVETPLMCSITD